MPSLVFSSGQTSQLAHCAKSKHKLGGEVPNAPDEFQDLIHLREWWTRENMKL
jgi:hypothetical protein